MPHYYVFNRFNSQFKPIFPHIVDGLLTHKHDEKELDGVVQSEDEASAGRSHGGDGSLAPFFLGYGAGVEDSPYLGGCLEKGKFVVRCDLDFLSL